MTEIEALIVGDSIVERRRMADHLSYEIRELAMEYSIASIYAEGYEIVKTKTKDN